MSLAFILILANFKLYSQTEPIEGSIEYQKGEKRAAIVEVPFPPELVEDALKDYLEKGGVKEERLKGMPVLHQQMVKWPICISRLRRKAARMIIIL